MKTCKSCSHRSECKEPCAWLNSQLASVEVKQEFPTTTELDLSVEDVDIRHTFGGLVRA